MINDPRTAVMGDAVTPSPRHPVTRSPLRAWCYLLWLCVLRLARVRQMVVIALALLALMASVVGLTTVAGRGGMDQWHWRWPGRWPPDPGITSIRLTYEETVHGMQLLPRALSGPAPALALQDAIAGASESCLKRSPFYLFSTWLVFSVFLGFLLPILSLSFATEALGG